MKEDTARERLMARRARERAEDQEAGRPQRGLFTGRGRRKRPVDDTPVGSASARSDHELDENFDDAFDDDFEPQLRSQPAARAFAARPRTGAKRSVMSAIRQIPSYARLLFGLMGDRRVSKVDRFFVVAAAAYMISPLDFIPDLIPFFG
ncbi:MAG TPA: YkvA family protein, partial [Gemmatimonas sp.]|nr:YkvA family protein [Gemmatimonas sp.]